MKIDVAPIVELCTSFAAFSTEITSVVKVTVSLDEMTSVGKVTTSLDEMISVDKVTMFLDVIET